MTLISAAWSTSQVDTSHRWVNNVRNLKVASKLFVLTWSTSHSLESGLAEAVTVDGGLSMLFLLE